MEVHGGAGRVVAGVGAERRADWRAWGAADAGASGAGEGVDGGGDGVWAGSGGEPESEGWWAWPGQEPVEWPELGVEPEGGGVMGIEGGWLTWAGREPGPPNKVYQETNRHEGIVCHSMEGWWAGSYVELMRPERQASWMFSNLRDGRFVQHYPITASPWTSGNREANTRYWSVESEGLAGTPLNEMQVANMLRLVKEWELFTGRKAQRTEPGRTIWNHHEVAQKWSPNAGATACPSGRYDGFYAQLEAGPVIEEGEVTREEYEALKAEIAAARSEIRNLNDALVTGRFPLLQLAYTADLERVRRAVKVLVQEGVM